MIIWEKHYKITYVLKLLFSISNTYFKKGKKKVKEGKNLSCWGGRGEEKVCGNYARTGGREARKHFSREAFGYGIQFYEVSILITLQLKINR